MMDDKQQADGEKMVREVLIEPLLRRGLAKPASLTREQFDAMVDDVCKRLAYMSAAGLAALEEVAASSPSGRERDRFPIANNILEWAAQIEPPEDSASPLIRSVFAHQIGLDAITQGYAPELLRRVRKDRRWPGPFVINAVRDEARANIRQMEVFEDDLRRGVTLSPSEAEWRDQRLAVIRKCQDIRALTTGRSETAA